MVSQRFRLSGIALGVTLLGHNAWEIGQAQFFADNAGAPLSSYALHCFVASLGDVVIAFIAFGVAALTFRRAGWPLDKRPVGPAAVWLVAGLAITVGFELYATATGRWAYAQAMPTVLGIGVLPLLQWIVLPIATLLLFRSLARLGKAADKRTSN